jgi:hypothetical protein
MIIDHRSSIIDHRSSIMESVTPIRWRNGMACESERDAEMQRIVRGPGPTWGVTLFSLLLLLLGGCASIKVSNRHEYQGEKLSRPDRIYVHDFAATVEDLPAWSEVAQSNTVQNATASA